MFTSCLTEFQTFLNESQHWRNNVDFSQFLHSNTQRLNTDSIHNVKQQLDLLIQKYILRTVNKETIVNKLINGQRNETLNYITEVISSVKNQFQNEVNTPMFTVIDNLEKYIFTVYQNIINNLLTYSEYMGRKTDIKGAEYIKVFRNMFPNFQRGTFDYFLTPMEVKILMGNDVHTYISEESLSYIEDIITNYLHELKSQLQNHFTEYIEIENKVLNDIIKLEYELDYYQKNIIMDHEFIRYLLPFSFCHYSFTNNQTVL